MISSKNEPLLPVAYDLIAENGLNYMQPYESNFIILKNNGRYGLTFMKYGRDEKRTIPTNTIEPVFTGMPMYFLKNYWGIQDKKLFGLFDGHFNFLHYANEKGVEYNKTK